MSITPVSLVASLLGGTVTPARAVVAKNADFHTQLQDYAIKDQVELSKGAIALLEGGAPPASAR